MFGTSQENSTDKMRKIDFWRVRTVEITGFKLYIHLVICQRRDNNATCHLKEFFFLSKSLVLVCTSHGTSSSFKQWNIPNPKELMIFSHKAPGLKVPYCIKRDFPCLLFYINTVKVSEPQSAETVFRCWGSKWAVRTSVTSWCHNVTVTTVSEASGFSWVFTRNVLFFTEITQTTLPVLHRSLGEEV